MRKIQPPSEKDEERQIIELYEQVGAVVIKFSQPHKATQTQGIADLWVLFPNLRISFWHECKRRQGPEYQKVQYGQTAHQKWFQEVVESIGHTYILGPLSTAKEHLLKLGIIR